MVQLRRITFLTAVLASACAPSAVLAASPLELPTHWYQVVQPYRYDEARRFEAGWNRGADVIASGSLVRSPVAGQVRYVGTIAGRTIVTIDAVYAGTPVVVTLTGVDQAAVSPGATVRRGEAVGRGSELQVGMYDQRRRSRYFPVVARRQLATAASRHVGDRGRQVGLDDVLADVLARAIAGTTGREPPQLAEPRLGSGSPGTTPGVAVGAFRTDDDPRAAHVAGHAGATPEEGELGSPPQASPHASPRVPQRRADAGAVDLPTRTPVAGLVVRTHHVADASRTVAAGARSRTDRPGSDALPDRGQWAGTPDPGWGAPTNERATPAASSPHAAAVGRWLPGDMGDASPPPEAPSVASTPLPPAPLSAVRPMTGFAPERGERDRADAADPRRVALVPVLVGLLAVVLVVAGTRRWRRLARRRHRPHPTRVARPLDVHLPGVARACRSAPRAGPPVGEDAWPLAWADPDPGSTDPTDLHSRDRPTARAPEHA